MTAPRRQLPHIPHLGAVVLAAGASLRLGRPKQLLHRSGHALVAHTARLALGAGAARPVVVVGAHASAVARALHGLPVELVYNDAWPRGMGASLRAGITALAPNVATCLYLLADQYAVTADHLRELQAAHARSGIDVTLTRYDERGTRGPPALLSSRLLPRAATLRGERGVRALLRPGDRIAEVCYPDANRDIDVSRDIPQLLK